MRTYNIGLIGFGGVNRALAELIRTRSSEFSESLGFAMRVVAITDLRLGSWIVDDGVDIDAALALRPGETFAVFRGGSERPDNERAIAESNADVIVEATFTNPQDGEPAVTHVRRALTVGKHVVTTNKGPVAFHASELQELARQNGVRFEFEGTVLSGTPILRFADQMLKGLVITGFEGILNGTSNYVLGRMETGLTLESAITEAQERGYAEADPTADISGSDVRLKVAILVAKVLGVNLPIDEIETIGIDSLSADQIISAARRGEAIKLIGSAHRDADGQVKGSVRPVVLAVEHPLAAISGATNAVSFHTDLLGMVTVSGPGAGRMETAYALLSDIIAIEAHTKEPATRG